MTTVYDLETEQLHHIPTKEHVSETMRSRAGRYVIALDRSERELRGEVVVDEDGVFLNFQHRTIWDRYQFEHYFDRLDFQFILVLKGGPDNED